MQKVQTVFAKIHYSGIRERVRAIGLDEELARVTCNERPYNRENTKYKRKE